MTSIRVRLCIDRDPCFKTEQCWMLVDTLSCKFIHDFEHLVRKKFFMDEHNVILNLYLDDFLLPSQEKIEIIRDNDVIRVKEDKASTFKGSKLSKLADENKNKNPKKRKFEDSKDSRKKSKKMKHSPTKNKTEPNFQGKNAASTKTSLNTSNKTKCQKAIEFLQKASADSSSQKEKKRETKSLKKKFQSSALNCILEKLHSSSSNKQISAPKPRENIALEKGSKKGIQVLSELPLSVQKVNRESNELVTCKDVENVIGIPGTKGDSVSSKQKGMSTVYVNKKSSPIQSSTSTSSSSSSCESSSDGESNTNIVKKGTFNGQAVSGNDELQGGLEPQTIVQDVGKENELHNLQKQRHDVCLPKQTTSNHIRFDYDSEHVVEKTAEKVYLPCLNNISPACSASTNNKATNGTPDLSPIQQNIELTVPSDNAQKRPTTENKDLKGRSRNNFRKDVYTYKSVVMESTRMEKEPGEALYPVPATNVPKKDFSQYQPLVGPPRVGETVAYKTLELSQSYTPEISEYKVGKVLSFDSASKSMKLKLTKESLTRATGDGHISLKFELYDGNEEEDSSLPVEIPDKVDVQWSEMIEPRLIVAPEAILK